MSRPLLFFLPRARAATFPSSRGSEESMLLSFWPTGGAAAAAVSASKRARFGAAPGEARTRRGGERGGERPLVR
eukprot:272150-Chlamydomonas_euryale.AAC.4